MSENSEQWFWLGIILLALLFLLGMFGTVGYQIAKEKYYPQRIVRDYNILKSDYLTLKSFLEDSGIVDEEWLKKN